MVSDDLGFLLIFIVLPTVLIVSGFWLILFIRREANVRSSVQPSPADEREHTIIDDFADPVVIEPEPVPEPEPAYPTHDMPMVIAALPPSHQTVGSVEDQVPEPVSALQGADAIALNLLHDSVVEAQPEPVSDARLLELVDPADRKLLADKLEQSAQIDEAAYPHPGNTQQLDEVETVESPPEPAPDLVEQEDEQPKEEPDVVPATEELTAATAPEASGNTAPLPENLDAALDDDPAEETVDDDEQDDDEQAARRRRQPEARLVRSTDNVKRRGRSGGRRVPPIVRPGSRDEDTVEGDDRS